ELLLARRRAPQLELLSADGPIERGGSNRGKQHDRGDEQSESARMVRTGIGHGAFPPLGLGGLATRKLPSSGETVNPIRASDSSKDASALALRTCRATGATLVQQCSRYFSDRDRRAVEARDRPAELLVEARLLLLEDAERDGLTEQHALDEVGAPVNARRVARARDVGRDLVQLVAHRQRRAGPGLQARAVGACLDRIRQLPGFVEERLQ